MITNHSKVNIMKKLYSLNVNGDVFRNITYE